MPRKNKEVVDSSIPIDPSSHYQRFMNFVRETPASYVLIIFIILLILTFLAVYLASLEPRFDIVPKCGDGTFFNTCSLDKPYYCEDGVLIEKSSVCGCPREDLDFFKKGESCFLSLNTEPKEVQLKYFFKGRENAFNFTVYEGIRDYVSGLSRVIDYLGSEQPFRVDFKLKSISDKVQEFSLIPLVKEIQNLAPNNKVDQVRIAISIVQHIPYGSSNQSTFFENRGLSYYRYPYEVLFDNMGICGEKSMLLTFLLKEIGYGTAVFYFPEENHEAVGIKCPIGESLYGSGFCFVETGGPSVISDISMDFVNGEKLDSVPQVLLISEGISLPEGLDEYSDADTLTEINNKKITGYLKFWKKDNIVRKYNLGRLYSFR